MSDSRLHISLFANLLSLLLTLLGNYGHVKYCWATAAKSTFIAADICLAWIQWKDLEHFSQLALSFLMPWWLGLILVIKQFYFFISWFILFLITLLIFFQWIYFFLDDSIWSSGTFFKAISQFFIAFFYYCLQHNCGQAKKKVCPEFFFRCSCWKYGPRQVLFHYVCFAKEFENNYKPITLLFRLNAWHDPLRCLHPAAC